MQGLRKSWNDPDPSLGGKRPKNLAMSWTLSWNQGSENSIKEVNDLQERECHYAESRGRKNQVRAGIGKMGIPLRTKSYCGLD